MKVGWVGVVMWGFISYVLIFKMVSKIILGKRVCR